MHSVDRYHARDYTYYIYRHARAPGEGTASSDETEVGVGRVVLVGAERLLGGLHRLGRLGLVPETRS